MKKKPLLCIILFTQVVFFMKVHGQELEARSLINLPVGTNFIVAGYSHARGNILMDPFVPIDGFNGNLNTFALAYLRSINLFGLSSKVDIVLPYATGDWEYNFQGKEKYDKSNGFGDLRIRFSFNFFGAPAIKNSEDFKEYKQKTVGGYIIQVVVPIGSYNSEQLPNLGSNRWAIRQQLGVSRSWEKWILEGYLALWLFTENSNYLDGNTMKQNPFSGIKVHFVRLFSKGMWLAADAGYGMGGSTKVNDIQLNTRISTLRLGLVYALPVYENHSLKFTVATGVRIERGPDFDGFGIVYQYRW